jgi:hypothetical protein
LTGRTPHVVLLYPFWGKNPEHPEDPDSGRFDDYTAGGSDLFSLVPLEGPDVAVLPFDWASAHDNAEVASAQQFLARAKEAVETNFLRRSRFLGGALPGGTLDPKMLVRGSGGVRAQHESDYVLCARGAGNFSYRLYETLSCGRIPVFVDTDCVLPYDFLVDWKDHCVWVDQDEIDRAGERVADFHERLTAQEFEDLQRGWRRLWEEYVRPMGFFSKFNLHFEARLPQPAATWR